MKVAEPNYSASQQFFQTQKEKAATAEQREHEKFKSIAVLRLGTFAGMVGLAVVWNKSGVAYWAIGIMALLVAFLILMRRQQEARRLRNFQKNLVTINDDELSRLELRFKRPENGIEFREKNHAYSDDLDIFGEFSLFKLLNRTHTAEGSRRLANWLKSPATAIEAGMRQAASTNFSGYPDLIQAWEATAMLHEHAAKHVGEVQAWSIETFPSPLRATLPWRWYPFITLVIFILYIAGIVPGLAVLVSLAIHSLILSRFMETVKILANRTTSMGQTLTAYAELLQKAESAPYQSAWWQPRKERIAGSSAALAQAGNLFEKLDYRNNPYFAIFVGITTLWDLHCLAGLEKWKAAHQEHLTAWLDVLADTEAMNSLAGHAFAHPDYVVPQVYDSDEVIITTTTLGHPLIPVAKRISNDFAMQGTGKTILVTGSNMSGKSTFLRTIGLNLVLAQTGAVVSAGAFACSPVRVFSSMRTQDSLEESTSSFYAELKRLRKLLELADERDQAPVFYLLDEILKGTNSADRHRGAEALIRQLHTKKASGMVSTHDLELGEWGATENYIHNFHFRSDVENGQLHFDYRLHEGICRSFNASELMRMMGIAIGPDKTPLAH
ncbi:DNA mismatch repair protein MutS [Dyadobacter sp. CY261]|uniref:MutS-related protein n=1 Tax=Dyadobacter sp. CY261 TaxID=2907203 RepID=UPI001F1DD9A1|nr:DNA mismatch repair protein MutS [Dyadobacter sp. CY261]MCF0072347.1 DNA mismatch repair protein MutS [Dyadobacter sp. CY261]